MNTSLEWVKLYMDVILCSPDICKLCMRHGKSANHLFLHCSLTLGLWHRLFQLTKMDWVPPRSISDMLSITYNGFGLSRRGIVLWQAACIALIWVVWQERDARIFQDKARNPKSLWDSIFFLASLWPFCSKVFKGTPLIELQLDWLSACSSDGLVQPRVVVRYYSVISYFWFLVDQFSLVGGFLILLLYFFSINIFLCRFLSKKKMLFFDHDKICRLAQLKVSRKGFIFLFFSLSLACLF